MNCPKCNGYMTYTKHGWYCKKCQAYTTPATASDTLNTTVQEKPNSGRTIKIIVSFILLSFDIGFLLNFQSYNQANKLFTIMFILLSVTLIIRWLYVAFKESENKEIPKNLNDNRSISKIKAENKKLKTLLSPELQNASNLIDMNIKLQKI